VVCDSVVFIEHVHTMVFVNIHVGLSSYK